MGRKRLPEDIRDYFVRDGADWRAEGCSGPDGEGQPREAEGDRPKRNPGEMGKSTWRKACNWCKIKRKAGWLEWLGMPPARRIMPVRIRPRSRVFRFPR